MLSISEYYLSHSRDGLPRAKSAAAKASDSDPGPKKKRKKEKPKAEAEEKKARRKKTRKKKISPELLALKNDIRLIGQQLNFPHQIKPYDATHIPKTLNYFKLLIAAKKPETAKKNLKSSLRILVSLLVRHQNKLFSSSSEDLTRSLTSLQRKLGSVPCLIQDRVPELPDQDLLSKTYKKNLAAEEWKSEPVMHGSRKETGFIVSSGKNVVRETLKRKAKADPNSHLEHGDKFLVLDPTSLDFHETGLMDADHFQASALIINRINEMLELMNADPVFYEEMLAIGRKHNYFTTDKSNQIVATKYLHLAYHNDMNNLWFLSHAENSGNKGAEDPEQWIKGVTINDRPVGENFLQELDQQDLCIERKGILFSVVHKDPLKPGYKDLLTLFQEWIMKRYASQIKLIKANKKHYLTKQSEATGLSPAQAKRKHAFVLAAPSLTDQLENSDSDTSSALSESAVAQLDDPDKKRLYLEALRKDPELKKFAKAARSRVRKLAKKTLSTKPKANDNDGPAAAPEHDPSPAPTPSFKPKNSS